MVTWAQLETKNGQLAFWNEIIPLLCFKFFQCKDVSKVNRNWLFLINTNIKSWPKWCKIKLVFRSLSCCDTTDPVFFELPFYEKKLIIIMLQGEEGVREVLQILNDEFRLSMALSGKTRMNEPWWCSRASTSNEGVCSLLVQAAGTWQRSTGTLFSSPSSDWPAEGSTVETVCTRRRPAEPQTVLGQKKWLEEDRKTLGGLCHIFSVYLCKTDLRARSTQPIIQVLLFFDIYFCPLGGWDRGINPSHQKTLGFFFVPGMRWEKCCLTCCQGFQ